MNNMGIQDLFIPASLSPLMAEAIRFKSIENQLTGKNELIVPESFLVEVFLHLGAIQMKNEGKNESNDPKSEENEEESKLIDLSNDNQLDESILPKELLDIKHRSGENILRAIFE